MEIHGDNLEAQFRKLEDEIEEIQGKMKEARKQRNKSELKRLGILRGKLLADIVRLKLGKPK